jgi:ribosome-interacting GTPase 1
MPTNLPPEYFDVEKRLRTAKTPAEKITCLEELITIVPKHKGTDKLRADLRKRLSKLKAASQTKKALSRRESAFRIDKEGAGQVVIVGPANVGKSALIATLTNATPEVADCNANQCNAGSGGFSAYHLETHSRYDAGGKHTDPVD